MVAHVWFSAVICMFLAACGGYEWCEPHELGKAPPAGEAGLYAYWTPNAFPLALEVDAEHGCPMDVVEKAAEFWAPHTGGFAPRVGRFRSGKDRDYGVVYLRSAMRSSEALGGRAGRTQLTANKGRAMYASITVDTRCDLATLTHELGHALGLDEAGRADAVMQPRESMDGWELSEGEADRLAYACEP